MLLTFYPYVFQSFLQDLLMAKIISFYFHLDIYVRHQFTQNHCGRNSMSYSRFECPFVIILLHISNRYSSSSSDLTFLILFLDCYILGYIKPSLKYAYCVSEVLHTLQWMRTLEKQ